MNAEFGKDERYVQAMESEIVVSGLQAILDDIKVSPKHDQKIESPSPKLKSKSDLPPWIAPPVYDSDTTVTDTDKDTNREDDDIELSEPDSPISFANTQIALTDEISDAETKICQQLHDHGWPKDKNEAERLSLKYGGFAPLLCPVQATELGPNLSPDKFAILGYYKGVPVVHGYTRLEKMLMTSKVWAGPDVGHIFLLKGPTRSNELLKWHAELAATSPDLDDLKLDKLKIETADKITNDAKVNSIDVAETKHHPDNAAWAAADKKAANFEADIAQLDEKLGEMAKEQPGLATLDAADAKAAESKVNIAEVNEIKLSIQADDDEHKPEEQYDYIDVVQIVTKVREDPERQEVLWRNRYFEVRASPLGGLGVFAIRDIDKGNVLLAEEPLLVLRTIGMDLFPAYKALDDGRRSIFDSLHGFSVRPGSHRIENIAQANAFEVHGTGVAILAIGSRFNHKCERRRNVAYSYDGAHKVMVFTAKVRVAKETELCINYGGTPIDLYRRYGFKCTCGACHGTSGVDWDVVIPEISKAEFN